MRVKFLAQGNNNSTCWALNLEPLDYQANAQTNKFFAALLMGYCGLYMDDIKISWVSNGHIDYEKWALKVIWLLIKHNEWYSIARKGRMPIYAYMLNNYIIILWLQFGSSLGKRDTSSIYSSLKKRQTANLRDSKRRHNKVVCQTGSDE